MAGYEKNLRLAEEHLEENETVKHSVFGAYETTLMGKETVRNGVFLVTEKRVVFYAKTLLGFEMESFPLQNISSVESGKNFMGHYINFFASGNKAKMKWIKQGDVAAFSSYIRDHIGKPAASPVTDPTESDIPGQIQKLATLRDQGILTDEEFTAKKTELLAKL